MEDDGKVVRLRDALGLGCGEHLLVWALRWIVLRGDICPVVAREFADICGEDGTAALATFRVLVILLNRTARRRLTIGHPGWFGLTGDERQLVSLVAAAQAGDQLWFDALLCWMVRREMRQQVATAVQTLAAAFASHNLMVSLPTPAMVGHKPDSRCLRLVS